jgi:hypothetical protein
MSYSSNLLSNYCLSKTFLRNHRTLNKQLKGRNILALNGISGVASLVLTVH